MVVASDYPDMEEVKDRLRKGAETEHLTFTRKGDRVMRKLAKEMELGGPLPAFSSFFEFEGEAYESEALNWADYVIVYHTAKSGVTKFYADKATKFPYDVIYKDKLEINEKKSKVTRKRAATRRAE
jgi:hypothetical protein